jgi:hypothetical protein
MKSEGFHNQLSVDIERFSTKRAIPGVREPGRLRGVRTGSGSDRIRKSRSALGFLLIRSLPLPVPTQKLRQSGRGRAVEQDALLEMFLMSGVTRCVWIMRYHYDRLLQFTIESCEDVQDLFT